MDINPRHRSLFLCGVAKDASNPSSNPAILSYNNDKSLWSFRGALERDSIKLVSCVKAMVQDSGNNFVTGESGKSANSKLEHLRFYDANSNSFEKLQPIVSYEEHEDIITSLTNYPNSEGLFFSGSRDCTVRVWDRRQPKSVGSFGLYQQSSGKIVAHESMITCLDAFDTILVSAGLDKKVMVWDLRTLDSTGYTQPLRKISVDDSAILKVSVGPSSNSAAVSTLKGLYLVDFTSGISKLAAPFKDKRPTGRYHDLKWCVSQHILFAAGDDTRVDQFVVR